MKPLMLLFAVTVCLVDVLPAAADGLIQSLPPDGSWVTFEAGGEGSGPRGDSKVTFSGTVTIKSVGREAVDGEECRWIEIATALKFERPDRQGEQSEVIKLLVPEKYLTRAEDPRQHVLKAWSRIGKDVPRELDLNGKDARIVESLDELFHAPFAAVGAAEKVEFRAPAGAYPCLLREGSERTQAGDAVTEMKNKAWLTDQIPFGVAGYRFEKVRSQNNKARGSRWMELKVAKVGTDAQSAVDK
jgi:hypothetical protein